MSIQPGLGRRLGKRTIIAALCVSASGIVVGLDAAPAAAETPESSAVNCARELYLADYWTQKALFAQDFLFSAATVNHYFAVAGKHIDRYMNGC